MSDLRLSRLAFATAALALLAACGEEAPSDDSRAATGEVLEGTISDAMLPLDQVRSQPPLVAPRSRSTGAGDADQAESGEGTEEAGAPADGAAPTGDTASPAAQPPVEAEEQN